MIDYKQKRVLLTCEPFVHVLTSKAREERCEECFNRQEKLLRCSACKVVKYCDSACQRKSWDLHKLECKCFQNVAPRIPTESVRTILRLILKQQKGEFKSTDDGKLRCFDDFKSHIEEVKRDQQRCEQFLELHQTLRVFTNNIVELPPMESIFVMFAKMCINSFSITDGEMQPIGVGIYLSASVFDHSCNPDAMVVFKGTTLEVRALHDISVTDMKEVRISYIDLMAPREDRVADLERYYFRCSCKRCCNTELENLMLCSRCKTKTCEAVILSSMDACPECAVNLDESYQKQKQSAISQCKDVLTAVKDNSNHLDCIGQITECLEQVKRILPPLNIYVANLCEKLFDSYINTERWEGALACGLKTREPHRKLLPKFNHNTGIHFMKLGKIQLYLQQLDGALQSLQEAETILNVTLGESHSKYQELLELITQCQKEMLVKLEHSASGDV